MLSYIILAQAIIYLILMPLLRANGELGYHPPVLVGALAAAAFAAGAFGPWRKVRPSTPTGAQDGSTMLLEPRPQLWLAMIGASLLYDIVSLRFGLLNRRQGSEVMAELFGTMPLWALAIIRGYELVFVPIIILYMPVGTGTRKAERLLVFLSAALSLPFMGIADSRGRIVVIAMTVISFLPLQTFLSALVRNIRAIFALLAVGVSFSYFSSQRAGSYYNIGDYLQVEVYQRLDGLNIVAQLREAHFLSYIGTWDSSILSPLISKIPFLEAAQQAKLSGLTSSKQYYMQQLLKSTRLDDSNSMITDPLYLGGLFGMVIMFALFGRCCGLFDGFVSDRPFGRDRLVIGLALAFLTSFITFEADFLGAFATMLQAWAILLVLLLVGCRYHSTDNGDQAVFRSINPVQAVS